MNFPAATNTTPAQPGPNYGCLGSQPNPTWFFMQIQNSGPLVIAMSSVQDIDFICWGPFPNLAGACSNLTAGNTVDCSYSGSNTETCTIANAIAGQFYLLLITNFSNNVQNITFAQTNTAVPGSAVTNCGLICIVTATNSGIICSGGNATVSLGAGTSTGVTSFTWTAPGVGVVSNFTTFTALNVASTRVYTVTASTGSTNCTATTTVNVVQYPNYTVTPLTPTICQGGTFSTTATFSFGTNPNNFNYSWGPNPGGGLIFSPFSQGTNITPLLLPVNVTLSTVVYSVTITPTALNCPSSTTMAVTINNPLTPTLTMPQPLCNTFNPIQLTAAPGGGTWSASTNNAVSPTGLLTPALASTVAVNSNSVVYSVSVGNCTVSNTGTFSVSRFNTSALTASLNLICVQDPQINLMNLVQSTVTGQWSGIGVTNNFFISGGLATGNYSLKYKTISQFFSPPVCPDSTFLLVSVFNPPTPTFSFIPPKCSNSPATALFATPVGGIWSLNSGVNSLGIQTPSLCGIGTNSVTYTAGQGTCVASSTATFHVSKFNPATLTGSVPNLCVSSVPFNLMSIVQNTNGYWSGVNVAAGLFNPSLPTNTYSLIYTTVSTPSVPFLCSDSKTIIASVYNPITPNITQAGPFCSTGAPVQLTVSPNNGNWSASSCLSVNGVFIPSLAAIGSNVVQYVIGTSSCNAMQTRIINVEAFVPATISNNIPPLCTTSSVFNLLPITVSNAGIWSGPGVAGANFIPSVAGAGHFVLTHKTSSSPSGLCSDQSTVAVNVFSLEAPAVVKVGPFCNSYQSIQLQVNPAGGLFGGANTNAISLGGMFNPALANIGNNIINYSVSSGPCIAYTQATISVERFVSANFEKYLEPLCRNNSPIDLNSLVQNPGGIWKGTAMIGSMFYPSKANIGSNNFIIYRTHSSQNDSLCPDTSAIRINVMDIPTVTVRSESKEEGCVPLEVKLSTPSVNSGKGVWSLGDGTEPKSGLFATHVFNTPGTYTVVFNYSNEAGCATRAILDKPIVVWDNPKANFIIEPEEVTLANPEVSLTNLSTVLGNNKYSWTIQGMNSPNDVSPRVTFNQIGKYQITLTAVTANACTDQMTRFVEVKNDFNLFIPNSFSPNADGLNDFFIPVFSHQGLDAKSFEMEIFNRWGQIIYHTKDVTKGWDGTFNNKGDITLKQDSYIYKIHYKDLDGKVYDKMGDLILLNQ